MSRAILLVLVCAVACGDNDDGGGGPVDAGPRADASADAANAYRGQCAPCEEEGDCDPPASCIDLGGEMRCSVECEDEPDCPRGSQCTDNQCRPRYGSCTGAGEFCSPCVDDADCTHGEQPTCTPLSGGERSCLDAAYGDACFNDEDCPESPSGLAGECLGQEDGVEPSESRFQRCHAPYIDAISDFSCWE